MPYFHWDDHSTHLMSLLRSLYTNLELTDCILNTNGGLISCHKTILVACSPYLKKLIVDNQGMEIIPCKEVKYNDMKLILDFVYFGEVEVSLTDVSSLIETARLLQIPFLSDSSVFFSEKSSCSGSCDRNADDSGTKCTENLSKYDDTDSSVQDRKLICSQAIHPEKENGLNVNCKNISESKTSTENELESLSQTLKDKLVKNNYKNSSHINVDIINKGAENCQDALIPFSFVAVSPFSVKSELNDELNDFCDTPSAEENPLEANRENDVTSKQMKWEKDFQCESEVENEIEEEDNVYESNSACESMETNYISHEGNDNMLKNTEKMCGEQSTQIVPLFERAHCDNWKSSFPEKLKDLGMEFESVCDIAKCELSEVKPLETGSIHEANDLLMSNGVCESPGCEVATIPLINIKEGVNQIADVPKRKSMKIEECSLVLERIDSCSEGKVDTNHAAFGESSKPSWTCTRPIAKEDKLETRSKGNLDCFRFGFVSSDTRHVDLETIGGGCSVHSGESSELVHTGEQRFLCIICNSSFGRKHDLMLHMRTHPGDKPFKCDICENSFSRKSYLSTHKRIHTGIKPFKCDICGVTFSEKGNLKRHMSIHNGDKPFKCDICENSYARKSYLSIHKRIHTGIKPFKCDICGVKFCEKGSLKVHMRTHTGEKPYKCEICGITYFQNRSLKLHRRIHTGINQTNVMFVEPHFLE